jgi:hypothetical protein
MGVQRPLLRGRERDRILGRVAGGGIDAVVCSRARRDERNHCSERGERHAKSVRQNLPSLPQNRLEGRPLVRT